MKKDRNSPELNSPDFSLPRSKILRGRKNFQRLFEKSTVLNSDSIQFRYRIYPDSSEGCLIGFAAPKKKVPKAVHRNRTKRLLREVYQHQQAYLNDLFDQQSFGFHGLFLANSADLSYSRIENDMISMLKKTRERLMRINSTTGRQFKQDRPTTEDIN